MRSIVSLNEEISRWAFELKFRNNKNWRIAFTNPTAGPWKTVKALSMSSNIEGEVYRFSLEEDRPDIIIYNDNLKVVIIFEAKDNINKLLDHNQIKKTIDVVSKLAEVLKSSNPTPFWKGREDYKILVGLLWGSVENPENDKIKELLFDHYYRLISTNKFICSDIVIGIETLYKSNSVNCSFFAKTYKKIPELVESLFPSFQGE